MAYLNNQKIRSEKMEMKLVLHPFFRFDKGSILLLNEMMNAAAPE